ncbi:sugar ABC transporter ATP-binding protein [Halomonas sp. S2151]|uniref:sugar ABC transporter ATP-binding protein n=2 Tax=Pseudomonadota TaxID=1224 RepID=UPI0005FA1ADD|nr:MULTISPECIES: sugar ABC transporter ATP-binding protein [unclassified Halomonas]KJZ04378.1 sugar ABC transporter ATP-binding protein [Halomonas sp. S2151]
MTALIDMRDIHKRFGGTVALDGASLTIAPGEVHALIGQNGAGKSTLIKVLTGVYTPTSGQILLDGKPVAFSGPRRAQQAGVATIYQELNLVPLRSVTENMMMGFEPLHWWGGIDWPQAHRRARTVLEELGLDIDVRRPLSEYSTAIQQLVAIGRAVSQRVRLVIMDEPTSSLDEREVQRLFEVIRLLKSQGTSVLFVSHFLEELYAVCDCATIMRNGATVEQRTLSETPRLELVASMLGRKASDIQASGTTSFREMELDTDETLLEVESLATDKGLRGASLEVHQGEMVGLGGLLGAGRSELARALFGLDRTTRGSMRLAGQRYAPRHSRDAIAAGVALLSEDRKVEGIIPEMSVRENMTLPLLGTLSRRGVIQRRRERELAAHYIEALKIKTASMEQPIGQLSGGNQQKVLLARWLATQPRLLILDEPTRGVDIGAKREIQRIVQDYQAQGGAVLMISSEFEELAEGAQRVVIMHEGHSTRVLDNPGLSEDALVTAIATAQHDRADGAARDDERSPATATDHQETVP